MKIKLLKDIKLIIKFVIDNWEEETEYDGRIERYCFFCDAYQDRKEHHKKNCLHLKAIKLLEELNKLN